jgi:hypothetical protein
VRKAFLGTLFPGKDVEASIREHVHARDRTRARAAVGDGATSARRRWHAWFKACAPVQKFEPRLTAALVERWPDWLPDVIAHNEKRAWLLLADAGEPLGIGGGPARG